MTRTFGRTSCKIHQDLVETTLPGGEVVMAAPQRTYEQRLTANRLGYGEDVEAMTRDHDPMHAWLCDALGLPHSTALMQTAGHNVDPTLAAIEEQAVLAVQALCVATGYWPWRDK